MEQRAMAICFGMSSQCRGQLGVPASTLALVESAKAMDDQAPAQRKARHQAGLIAKFQMQCAQS
jgi:hypothetical protein